MTTSPSNETHDEWSDAPTMAGSIPTTMASRTATGFDVTAPTAARPYVPDLAWSAEPPEIAEPLSPQRPRRWSMRSGVLTFVGGGLIAAAAAGIFGALHGLQSTPAATTSRSTLPLPLPPPLPPPLPLPPHLLPPRHRRIPFRRLEIRRSRPRQPVR